MATEAGSQAAAAVQIGDFGSWMASEQRRIFLLCRRMLQDQDEADTATQDVFLKAYRALQKGAAELEHADRWITRIAVNTCLDRLRSRSWKFWRKRPSAEDESLILSMTPVDEADAERQLFSRQIQVELERALAKLSDRQRAVFTLRHFDEMSLDEIAATLKLDSGTVKAHLFRATQKLKEELKELYLAGGRPRL